MHAFQVISSTLRGPRRPVRRGRAPPGGSDEAMSVATIRNAIDSGVNLIDTAPVYGFGRSEEIVKILAIGAYSTSTKNLRTAPIPQRSNSSPGAPCPGRAGLSSA